MDEHDKRAREVDAGAVLAEVCRALGVRLSTAEQDRAAHATVLAALRSTAAAAVAAERERCAGVAERYADGSPAALRIAALIRAAPLASPAQAERVSEEGWAANAQRQLERGGGWHVPGYSEDEHAVRFETVTDAHARGCRETQVRIAARLRARAESERRKADIATAREDHGTAMMFENGAVVLSDEAGRLDRAEADALEGT